MAVNFVKFQRGPQNIYDSLVAKQKIDENTLYFIYDPNTPEDGGLLYLGYTLIGGTGSNLSSISLNNLTDVSTNNARNGSVLWYNEQLSKWEPATPTQIVNASDKLPSVRLLSSESGQTPQEVLMANLIYLMEIIGLLLQALTLKTELLSQRIKLVQLMVKLMIKSMLQII